MTRAPSSHNIGPLEALRSLILGSALLLASVALPGRAHAQTQLSFSGGNNSPMAVTLAQPITLTITQGYDSTTAYLDVVGLSSDSYTGFSGTIALSVTGGTANPFYSLNYNSVYAGDVGPSDYFQSNTTAFTAGQTVTVSAGTLNTSGNYTTALPASGSYDALNEHAPPLPLLPQYPLLGGLFGSLPSPGE